MKNTLFIQNSLSKKKEEIILSNQAIKLYVCGITPYADSHIGHARCYLTYDILVRLIRYFNYKVTYVRNVTDIDDKLIEKAQFLYKNKNKYKDIAFEYYLKFRNVMNQFGCLEPDFAPKVTESISDIIFLIKKIITNHHAYETVDGVYFAVDSFDKYGDLSGRYSDKEKNAITRMIKDREKKNNFDFALWKKINEEPFWESPWGLGRPGWHIECSAMILQSFNGETIDIHGGGADLIFPHHENEKAQTECCQDTKLTKIWMHTAFININKVKMSKSLDNYITIENLFTKIDPMIFRFYLLMHNYTCPIEFSFDAIEPVKKSYIQLIELFNKTDIPIGNELEAESLLNDIYDNFFDNLNTAEVIGLVFKNKKLIENNVILFHKIKNIFIYILGLSLKKIDLKNNNFNYSDEIKLLITEREEARKNKNYELADKIRAILLEKNIYIEDKK